MKNSRGILPAAIASCLLLGAFSGLSAAELAVKITPDMATADVRHQGKRVVIMRNQDQQNTVDPGFAKTSRKCPPYCIRPFVIAKGVDTVGELEVITLAQTMSRGDNSIMLLDNRTPDWHKKGTIPGAINLPFTMLNRSKGADDVTLAESLEMLGALETDQGWDFSQAKTVVMFCNGMWCGQSPLAIDGLLAEGYPAEKIKWYRGGMQSWQIVGLTTIKP